METQSSTTRLWGTTSLDTPRSIFANCSSGILMNHEFTIFQCCPSFCFPNPLLVGVPITGNERLKQRSYIWDIIIIYVHIYIYICGLLTFINHFLTEPIWKNSFQIGNGTWAARQSWLRCDGRLLACFGPWEGGRSHAAQSLRPGQWVW